MRRLRVDRQNRSVKLPYRCFFALRSEKLRVSKKST